jgi:hypothetical protein
MITDEKIVELIAGLDNFAKSVDLWYFGLPCKSRSDELKTIVRQWLEKNGLEEKITVKNDPVCKRTDCLFYDETYTSYCRNPFVSSSTCNQKKRLY